MSRTPPIRVFGRFRVLGVAGKGGMAVVYRACLDGTSGFSRPVALKQLRPWISRDPYGVRLFVEEARVSARLDHPNIVQVHEFGQDRRGKHFLVLEWVEGMDLRSWINAHPLGVKPKWELVAAIGVEVLDALDFAHRHTADDGRLAPIIHRDVSPGNILLGLHGHAKLTDFGLARAMDRARMTAEDVLKGKVSYTAPELVEGAPPSRLTDQFSLGVTLWESLTRRRLFDADTDVGVLKKVIAGDIPDILDLRPDVPASVAAVIQRALRREPVARHQSARAMRRALSEALIDERQAIDPLDLGRSVAMTRHRVDAEAPPAARTPAPSAPASEPEPFDLRPSARPPSEPFELIPFEEAPEPE